MYQEIFAIPELAELCLLNLKDDKGALYAIMRTCSILKDRAVPILWSDLDSLVPLLLLLGLKNPQQAGVQWFFPQRPTLEDWATFQKYNSFVRRVKLASTSRYKLVPITICATVFSTIAFSRPHAVPLLPELQTISITTSKPQHQLEALIWLSPTVQAVRLNIGGVDSDAPKSGLFLREISMRCPNLKCLDIMYALSGAMLEDSLVQCLSGLPLLEQITFPWGFLQSRTFDTLSQCRELRKVLTVGIPVIFFTRPPSFTSLPIHNNSFNRLVHLSLFTTLTTVTKLISQKEWAGDLNTLEVTSMNDSTLEDIRPFFTAIQSSRPRITVIRLDFMHNSRGGPAFSFEHLLPLLDYRHIRRFFVRHQKPFTSTSDQLKQILLAWPELVELSLCADPAPATNHGVGMPLDSLALIGQYRPNIQDIGMYFSTGSAVVSLDTPRLEHLATLHVGNSPPPDIFLTAVFLGELCSLRMNIIIGEREFPWRSQGSTIGSTTPKDVKNTWGEVELKFKHIARMRDRVHLCARVAERSIVVSRS